MFLNFLIALLNTILEKLQGKLADTFIQAWANATRKIWRQIKTSWRFPRKALGPLGTLLLLAMGFATGHHAGVSEPPPLVSTQAIFYQVSGGKWTKLDSLKWMKDGIVESGMMIKQLMSAGPSAYPKYITYRVPYGRKLKLRLPDGSFAHANAATSFRLPQNFGKDNREIIIEEGELYLDVVPNETKVFTVHTPKVEITVLGTSFNINNYSSNKYCQVSVLTGKVLVTSKTGSKENKAPVPADKAAVIDKLSGNIDTETIKPDEVLAWCDGKCISNGKKVKEVCQELERMYNLRISIDHPSVGECVVYLVVFSKNHITDFFKKLQDNDPSIQYHQDPKGTWHLSKIIN